jgi:carbon-monoxide dehydrogenase small subunit
VKSYHGPVEIRLTVNGEDRTALIRPGDTLLRTLRDTLGLAGTKLGCENGDCGACTVLVDKRPMKSCLVLTAQVEGRSITTIEGLRATELQGSFCEAGGFQCGYCTSGVIMNAWALLDSVADPSEQTVREWMESNLCRCTGYEGIQRAIRLAQRSNH